MVSYIEQFKALVVIANYEHKRVVEFAEQMFDFTRAKWQSQRTFSRILPLIRERCLFRQQ